MEKIKTKFRVLWSKKVLTPPPQVRTRQETAEEEGKIQEWEILIKMIVIF